MEDQDKTKEQLVAELASTRRLVALLEAEKTNDDKMRHRAIFEHANDAIFIENLDDEILDANPRACLMMGYTKEELLQLRVSDLQAPEFRGQPGRVVQSELLQGGVVFESVNLRKDGSRVEVEVSNARVEHTRQVISIVRDITERKWVEAALQDNESRYRSLFENSPISLWEEDFSEARVYLERIRSAEKVKDWQDYLTGHPDVVTTCLSLIKIIDVNRSTLALYKASTKDSLLMRPETGRAPDLIDLATVDLMAGELTALMDGKTSYQSEAQRYTLTGDVFIAVIHITLAPGFEKTWGKVFISVMDISQSKQAEEALRLSEEKFSKAFRISPDSIAINRMSDGVYLEINQGFTQLLGYTQEEVLGKSSLELEIWTNPGDRAALVKGLIGLGVVENLEAVFRRKNNLTGIGLMSARVIEINGEKCILSITRDITDRKRVEEQLRESELRYRRLFEDSPISLWEEDFSIVKRTLEALKARGVQDWDDYFLAHPEVVSDCLSKIKVIDINQKTLDLYKTDSKNPLMAGLDAGQGLNTIPKASLDMLRQELTALVQGKTDFQGEFTMLDLKGGHFTSYVHLSIAPGYEDSWGKILVSVTDITAQIRAGRLLKTLNSVAEATQRVLFSEEILQLVADELKQIALTCTVFMCDWAQNKLIVKYISYQAGAVQTAQKLLGMTREKFFIPLDGANDLVKIAVQGKRTFYIKNPRESVRQFLPAALQGLAGPITETLSLLKSINAPLIVEDNVIGVLSVQSDDLLESDIPVVTAFANQVAAAWRKSQLYEKAQEEIAARKQAEDEIRLLNQSLEQRIRERTAQLESINKELEAFSYSVSHDLRAPLRAINGFSRILVEDYHDQLDQEGQGYLLRVRNASETMSQLIDDLLRLSRLTRQEMKRSPVDLSEMARGILRDLGAADPQRDVTISIAEHLTVEGDSHLLSVMLENLLGNAWKFTSRRPQARIEFNCAQIGNEKVFFVRDNGAGFDLRYQDKLFGAFQRLHSAEDFEGNGIGLATVKRIILRHGGRVWAEGELDLGATFYFTLP